MLMTAKPAGSCKVDLEDGLKAAIGLKLVTCIGVETVVADIVDCLTNVWKSDNIVTKAWCCWS